MPKPLFVPVRDGSEELFILVNGFLEESQEALRVHRRSDNPGVQWCRPGLRIVLAKVQNELEGVVSDLEMVGVLPVRLTVMLHVLAFTVYDNLSMQRLIFFRSIPVPTAVKRKRGANRCL
jgi:hypothetical protein